MEGRPRTSSVFAKAGKWKDAMEMVRVHKYNYFKHFVPNVAIQKLVEIAGDSDSEPGWARTSKAPPLEAEMRPCVILQVDISGFTRLSDRFQGFGQEGIDMLTTTINRMFGIIIDHVESWSGDIIKFAGDAVIVLWPCTEETMAQVTLQALTCAMELERQHGIFKVHVPDARSLAFADQVCC
jgi:class 3 adenylate cyclase